MTMKNGANKSSVFATSLLFTSFIAGQFGFSYAGHSAPVLIWCPNNQSEIVNPAQLNTAANPLQKVPSEDFEKTLAQLGKIIDLLIVSDELCVEDFKNNKVLLNITNLSRLYYFPCVDAPYSAFHKTFTYKQIKTIEDINDDHELSMALKDTDSSMSCIALTGKKCRYSYMERVKREVLADNSTEFKIKTDRVLFYSSEDLLFKTATTPEKGVSLPGSEAKASSRTDTNGTIVLNIKFSGIENIGDLTLEFFFSNRTVGYYALKKINYEMSGVVDTLETKRDIYFAHNFSYHCSLNTLFVNGTTYLNIMNMQVQIDSQDATFKDAYDCVGFTSIPIWAGIFVTAILALIMIWALTMIMDIRTMDRFDDPKGKTITISAAE